MESHREGHAKTGRGRSYVPRNTRTTGSLQIFLPGPLLGLWRAFGRSMVLLKLWLQIFGLLWHERINVILIYPVYGAVLQQPWEIIATSIDHIPPIWKLILKAHVGSFATLMDWTVFYFLGFFSLGLIKVCCVWVLWCRTIVSGGEGVSRWFCG